jgi:rhamnogalacturonyl hydrolase YesR
MQRSWACLAVALFFTPSALAADRADIGLAASGARIEAAVVAGPSPSAPTVLIIGGMNGSDDATRFIHEAIRKHDSTRIDRRAFRLVAIPVVNPDRSRLVFPPTGAAYRENAESHALWRWMAIHAPDLVIVAGEDDGGLSGAMSEQRVAEVGWIPVRRVKSARDVLSSVPKTIPSSGAHEEIDRRQRRTPQQLADELADYYGHNFDQPTYLQGMALIGRMRLGQTESVAPLMAPYLDGQRDSLAKPNSLVLAGHLAFAELGERTGDGRAARLARRAADLGFTEGGEMKASMPFHDEMSDSIFMAIPLLAKTGRLTGERKYFDMAARHLAFMQTLVLRQDGLYRHSPLTDAAWGRGNAFPALGLALTLSSLPKDHAGHGAILTSFQQHMAALARWQDEEGMWRQVIDHPGAYQELSATAMVATSMLRGIRSGWLDIREYQPRVDKAWRAVLARVGSGGRLMDVCESTNKQKSLTDYLRRAAIAGEDARGGAMVLLFATEMAGLK